MELEWMDWQCPRCGSTQQCLTDSGTSRVPHLRRIIATAVFAAAQLCSRWIPARERLLLATLVTNTTKTEAPSDTDDWWKAALAFQQGTIVLRNISQIIEEVGEPYVATQDLIDALNTAGELLDDAGDVMSEVRNGKHPVDEETLKSTWPPSPAVLRLARRRGDLQVLIDDMRRRSDVAGEVGQQWEAAWDSDGSVEATAENGVVVKGWAACPEAVPQLVGPWETTSNHRPVLALRIAEHRDTAPDWNEGAGRTRENEDAAFDRGTRQIGEVVEAVHRLRESWPADEVEERVREAARRLQEIAPQAPHFNLFRGRADSFWGHATSCGWVRTEAIVEAGDEVWGQFDRMEKSRGPVWTPRAAAEMLAVPEDELPSFLRRHLLDAIPVDLYTLNGPAGPIHGLSSNGAHRTHLFKILGLPWLFAVQNARIPSRRIDVASVIDTSKGIPEAARTIALWEGLLERGLLKGEIERQGAFATLHLDHAPAPWMLGSRDFAAAYNHAYERVYPGALSHLGVPPEALINADGWESWLTGCR